MGGPQDWLVVTVEGLLLLLLDEPGFELDVLPELPLELLAEELESSPDDVV
jgi:hypothetical protein